MNIKLSLVIICLFCASVCSHAQKRARRTSVVPVKTVSAEELFNQYSFDAAVSAIQKELQATKKTGSPTYELQQLAEKIRIGQNMIQSTEKVAFVDSFVVNKDDLLNTIKLSSPSGTLMTYGKAFPEDTKAGKSQKSSTVFLNEFGDHIIYSAFNEDDVEKLYERILLGKQWSASKPLPIEVPDSAESMSYPFLMPDGTTLYFAMEGEGSLGGYDIFVTRYNSDTGEYVKAENLGMPFNSPANDYLYVIDENSGLGWFASDRNQEEGKVCVYLFIPNTSRETYSADEFSEDEIKRFAQIQSIEDTQSDSKAISAAKKQLESLSKQTSHPQHSHTFTFYVASGLIYHSLDDFKSATAMKNAIEWTNKQQERGRLLANIQNKRHQWNNSASDALKSEILTMEKTLSDIDKKITELESIIRSEEQKKLNP